MAESPDESFEMLDGEDNSCHSNISDNVPEQTGYGVKRSFCCKKHKALFMTSSNSIRSFKLQLSDDLIVSPDFVQQSSCTSRYHAMTPSWINTVWSRRTGTRECGRGWSPPWTRLWGAGWRRAKQSTGRMRQTSRWAHLHC